MNRIEEIEQKILELAQREIERFPEDLEEKRHYNGFWLGDWAREVIKLWMGEKVEIILREISSGSEVEIKKLEFNPVESQSKFKLVEHFRDFGRFNYEITSPEAQMELEKLVDEWEFLLNNPERERERERKNGQ